MSNRLFEIFNIVNNTNVGNSKDKIVDKFINYCLDYLDIESPEIEFSDDYEFTDNSQSFGGYYPTDKKLLVVRTNRHIVDIFRTLAHELVHHKQNLENRLNINSGDTGSDIENEANSIAAIIMRNFSKENPEIFKM